jgi:hypothetical protein
MGNCTLYVKCLLVLYDLNDDLWLSKKAKLLSTKLSTRGIILLKSMDAEKGTFSSEKSAFQLKRYLVNVNAFLASVLNQKIRGIVPLSKAYLT